jgi:SH3-like domain-containing protein
LIYRFISVALAAVLLSLAQGALADLDYVTTGRPAILYDGPSTAANKTVVVGAGHPFEVLERNENWLKVRDSAGDLLWIESAATQGRPAVIVTATTAAVLERPQFDAPTRYRVSQNVTLERVGESTEPGWIKVRHPQGGDGYMRLQDIWGQ